MPRGHCPDSLAAKVHALTLAHAMHRCGPNYRQTIPDVVGEAFVRWLASPADKTEHAPGEHANFVARDALRYLTCRRAQRQAADHARPYSEEDCALFHHALSDVGEETCDVEGEEVARLDALRALARRDTGRQTASMVEALKVLAERGWSLLQIAYGAGVSETAVQHWVQGARRATSASIATVIRLAATDGPPPAHDRRHVPPPVVVPARITWKMDWAELLARGWTSYTLAQRLDLARDTTRTWGTGERAPNEESRAKLRALVIAGDRPDPKPKPRSKVAEAFLAESTRGPVAALQHPLLSRHALERLVVLGVAQRIERLKEGRRKRDRREPRVLVVYVRGCE